MIMAKVRWGLVGVRRSEPRDHAALDPATPS